MKGVSLSFRASAFRAWDSGNSQTGTPAERCDVTPLGCNALCEDILEYVGLFDSGETDVQALKFDTQSAVVDTH